MKSDKKNDKPIRHMIAQKRSTPKIEQFFRAMMKTGASDLHIKPHSPPHIRINTVIRATKSAPLEAEQIAELAEELMDEEQKNFFLKNGNIDVAYEIEGEDRFRINIFRQRGNVSLAVRRVTRDIPTLESMHLPPIITKIAEAHQGLILLAGPTGCGKSTTIATMIEHINQTRRCHIVTIEDPIEFLYEDKKALVSQREIGIDVPDFETALKYLMREDPDVVLIGELRDKETFQAALQAAETGHLVFGTVHAANASQTVTRILQLFEPESRAIFRQSLAANLRAIVCQMLLPCLVEEIDRIPTVEILLSTPTVRQLFEDSRDVDLPEVIAAGKSEGMQTFTQSLHDLIENEYVDPNVAYSVAPNVEELKMALRGISSGRSGLIGR